MNYTVLVTGSLHDTQHSSTAFLFCQSLLKMNHCLNSVFFYYDGVFNANNMNQFVVDDVNLVQKWQKLGKNHNVALYVCVSAASKRGIIEDMYLSNQVIKKGNLAPFFQFSGLLELANSIHNSDRIIQF